MPDKSALRRILAHLALIVSGLFYLICPGQTESKDTLHLFFWENPGRIAATYDLVRDFESLHDGSDGNPALKVTMGQSAEIDQSGDCQRLLCSIAGGNPADVVFFARFAVGEAAARGAFLSLQPFLERDWAERPNDPFTVYPEMYYRSCWEEGCWNDEMYALPLTTDNRALYYNLDYLERYADKLIAIGCVDPNDPTKPGPPKTWSQLRKCTQILSEYRKDGKLFRAGFIPNYGNSWLYLYGWLNGGKYLSPDGRTCLLNAPEIVEALAYMTEVYDLMGGAAEVYRFQSTMQGGDLDPFLTGKVAIKIDGDWFLPAIARYRRDLRFGVALPPAPEGKPQFGWLGGWSYVIPRGARHPEASWELIKYLVSKRAAGIWNRAMRQTYRSSGQVYIPASHARQDINLWNLENFLYNDPSVEEKFKQAARVMAEDIPHAKYRPVSPAGQILWSEHVRAMEGGIFKRYDTTNIRRNAQLALDESNRIVQAELDRFYRSDKGPQLPWWLIFTTYGIVFVVGLSWVHLVYNRKSPAHGYFRLEHRAGYLFALPWFIGFVVFGGGPIIFSFLISLCSYDVLSPPTYIGLQNYIQMFVHDNLFYKSLLNTLFMALGIPLGMALSLALALLLNMEVRGMSLYRTFFYLPAIVPAVAASILWIWILNPEQGILNSVLATVGITGPAWLQNQNWSKPALIMMGLWSSGSGMIIWMAGLKGIPRHLYEAAEMDGANRIQRFRCVTIPMLTPYILFNLIMGLIGTFQIFTQAYVMTQGGPLDSTLFYAYALFNNAFRYLRLGYASAMAWVLFAIVLVLTVLQLRLSKRWVYYEAEK
jgi:multiple sugar transport system permease protein